jgi:hypothetical protein
MKHYLGICLVLITLAGIVLFGVRSCVSSVDETVDRVRDAFGQVLRVQPQVTVNHRVLYAQTAPIAELAVVVKDEQVTLGLDEHLEVLAVTIPLTEKKLTAEGTFRIKAGFDLSQPFSVDIDPTTHAVHAAMPHAKILSVEPIGEISYQGEDAMLNRITDAERSDVLNNLTSAARSDAENSNLKRDAEQQVEARLQELINHNGRSIQIDWGGPALMPAP